MRIGVVLAGGAPSQSSPHLQVVPRPLAGWLAAGAFVVAADSGLDLARHLATRPGLELRPDLVVGDLDSVSAAALDWATQLGVEVRRAPTDKDETDLDLAFAAALDAGAERLVVLGGHGGRLDHLLGNLGALARVGTRVPTEAWLGGEFVAVLAAGPDVGPHAAATWSAALPAGSLVSVLAQGAGAVVSESGVRWALDHRRLATGSTQGVSNEAAGSGEPVHITVHEGVALVVVPDAKDLP